MYRGLWNLITKYLDNSHAVSVFLPVIIDKPVLDGPGSVGQEGAPAFLVGQNRLIKGQHGDTQLVLMTILRDSMDEFHRL